MCEDGQYHHCIAMLKPTLSALTFARLQVNLRVARTVNAFPSSLSLAVTICMRENEVQRLAQKVSTMSLVFLIANNYQLYCENNADVIDGIDDIFCSAM